MDREAHASPIVVVVDDDRGVRALVHRTLRGEGLEVISFPDAAHAIEFICEHGPAFVIADLVMPGESGVALAQELRKRLHDLAPPIALVSGSLEELAPEERGLFDCCLAKPFRIEALRSLARELLRRSRAMRKRSGAVIAAVMGDEVDDSEGAEEAAG